MRYFHKPKPEENPNLCKCNCVKKLTQKRAAGWTNLMNHIKSQIQVISAHMEHSSYLLKKNNDLMGKLKNVKVAATMPNNWRGALKNCCQSPKNVTKALVSLNLVDARILFSAVLNEYEDAEFVHYLQPDSPIIQSPQFESAKQKTTSEKEDKLSEDKKEAEIKMQIIEFPQSPPKVSIYLKFQKIKRQCNWRPKNLKLIRKRSILTLVFRYQHPTFRNICSVPPVTPTTITEKKLYQWISRCKFFCVATNDFGTRS